ncbi:MAG: PDZ domain-containing protein [Candidatus Binataceae bacterium]
MPDGQIVNYEHYQNPTEMDPQLHSLQEFMAEGDETSPLGIEVREARRRLKSGEMADGLLIVGVINGSPAAKAGLHAYSRMVRDILEGATIAAALVFAPAVLAVPVVDQIHIGETYDMIIGVDGARVTNFLEFEDRLHDLQPGEIVYLSIVRDGRRMQVPVKIPATMPASAF